MTPTEANHYLTRKVESLTPVLQEICFEVLNTQLFTQAYGSSGKHHAYPGGLCVHTAEVMEYALSAAGGDPQILIPAALFHDAMKIYEYMPDKDGKIPHTKYRTLIRHVAGSYAEFHRLSHGKLDRDTYIEISHCLLSHHGRPEWGSAIVPQTPNATILHWADMMSWQFGEGR